MRPAFVIKADDKDVTQRLNPRLISLTITDEVGMKADQLEIELDDRDGVLEVPAYGMRLAVQLGYFETGVADMGSWTVTEISFRGWPATKRIVAQAADVTGTIKAGKTRTWRSTTFAAIATTVAKDHGLKPVIDKTLGRKTVGHVDQTGESDLHFLTRLGRQFGATVKPCDGKLIVACQGKGKSAGDQNLTPVTVEKEDITDYSCDLPERGSFSAVSARWHNIRTGKTETVTVKSDNDDATGPVYTLPDDYPDQGSAKAAADAKKDALDRNVTKLSISMPGNPLAAAEVPLVITGVREGIDTTPETAWRITKVVHNVSSSSYTTDIEAELGDGAVKDKKKKKKKSRKKKGGASWDGVVKAE